MNHNQKLLSEVLTFEAMLGMAALLTIVFMALLYIAGFFDDD